MVILQDFTVFDDALHFLYHRITHAHLYTPSAPLRFVRIYLAALTLFPNEGIIAVVRVIGVSHGGTATF